MLYSTTCPSPVGTLTLAGDGEALAGLWMEGQKYFGGAHRGALVERQDLPLFGRVREWLAEYFAGGRPAAAELPLAPAGSDFRQGVWQLLCEIPYGQVVTYGQIAGQLAASMNRPAMSCQAVGGAVGHNPVSIIIPCHRVVGANGSLTGYAGGIQTKLRLLQHEGADTSRLFVPARGTAL